MKKQIFSGFLKIIGVQISLTIFFFSDSVCNNISKIRYSFPTHTNTCNIYIYIYISYVKSEEKKDTKIDILVFYW